jgi:DnaJ-domain-containing protein 1
LNYSEAEVASAIRSFVDGSSNAAGFSQSQHNCESWDDDDDGAVLPSFDSPANAACKLPAPSKAEAAAVVKELRQAMENSTPTSLANAISRCEELTEELNTRRKLQMGGGAPSKGTIVSGKLRAKSRKRKHEKQY